MSRAAALGFALWACAVVATPVAAHSMGAALLRLDVLEDGTTRVLLKVPLLENGPTTLKIDLPSACTDPTARERRSTHDAFIESWQVSCSAEALQGGALAVHGLNPVVGELFVHVQRGKGDPWTAVLGRGSPNTSLWSSSSAPHGPGRQAGSGFFALGVDHILSGPDHLLFVFALLLLIVRAHTGKPNRDLIVTMTWTITAFTVAHSITLAASVLGLAHVPMAPVEIVIPLSVLLLAVELTRERPEQTLTARYPWAVAFAFGLLHGFGFAGALREIGIPEEAIGRALVLFNLGVEAGQLMFLGAAAVLWGLWRRTQGDRQERGSVWARRFERVAVYGIGVASVFWCLQRAWMS